MMRMWTDSRDEGVKFFLTALAMAVLLVVGLVLIVAFLAVEHVAPEMSRQVAEAYP